VGGGWGQEKNNWDKKKRKPGPKRADDPITKPRGGYENEKRRGLKKGKKKKM